jgi:hypothetical protein
MAWMLLFGFGMEQIIFLITNFNLSIGQRISVYKTMAANAANETILPSTGLIVLDGLVRVSLNGFDVTFYKPYLENISSSAINITFAECNDLKI